MMKASLLLTGSPSFARGLPPLLDQHFYVGHLPYLGCNLPLTARGSPAAYAG
jgi:hypothetical protein